MTRILMGIDAGLRTTHDPTCIAMLDVRLERWADGKRIIGRFGYAPEINTLFAKVE